MQGRRGEPRASGGRSRRADRAARRGHSGGDLDGRRGVSYEALHSSEHAANYVAEDPARGRVDFLFALRSHGRAMLERARAHAVLGETLRGADAADLIGLNVQASSNDPSRRRRDLADIERLLQAGGIDLSRVREYFRLFDREKELDALLAGELER